MEHLLHIVDLRHEVFTRLDNMSLANVAQTCKAFQREARAFMKTNVAIVNKVLDILEIKARATSRYKAMLDDIQYTFQWWHCYDFRNTPLEALQRLYDRIQSSGVIRFGSWTEFIPTMMQYLLVRDDYDLRWTMFDCLATMDCVLHADKNKHCCRGEAMGAREEAMGQYIEKLLSRGYFHAIDIETTKTSIYHCEIEMVKFLIDREADSQWSDAIENVCMVLQSHLLHYYERFWRRLNSFRRFKATAAALVERRIGPKGAKYVRRYSFRNPCIMRPCMNSTWSFFLSAEM